MPEINFELIRFGGRVRVVVQEEFNLRQEAPRKKLRRVSIGEQKG